MMVIMYAIARTGFKQWSLAISHSVSLSRVHASYPLYLCVSITTKCMIYRTGSLGELRELGSSAICYSTVLLSRTNTEQLARLAGSGVLVLRRCEEGTYLQYTVYTNGSLTYSPYIKPQSCMSSIY